MQKILLSLLTVLIGAMAASSQTFTNYTAHGTSSTLCFNYVNDVVVDNDGNKWFATDEGLSKFDGTNWTSYLKGAYISALAIDKAGNVWSGLRKGASMYDGKKWTSYGSELHRKPIKDIEVDSDGNIWFATYGGGVTKFDGTNWVTYTTSDGLVFDCTECLAFDKQGNLWVGTHYNQHGCSKFDGTTWTTYTKKDGLRHNDIDCITVGKDGKVWFGTYNGYSIYDNGNWQSFAVYNGVSSINEDNEGNIWLSTSSGLGKFVNNSIEYMPEYKELFKGTGCTFAMDAQNNMWIGSRGIGAACYNGSSWKLYLTEGLVGNWILDVYTDTDNNKWFGTRYGLSKFDGAKWATYTMRDGLGGLIVLDIDEDKDGNIWVLSGESMNVASSLDKFDGTKWTTMPTPVSWLSGIETYNNQIWLSSPFYGIYMYDGSKWTKYDTSHGLSSKETYSVAIDKQGTPWGLTDKSLCRFNGTKWESILDVESVSYDQCAIVFDGNNNVWVRSKMKQVSKYDGTSITHYALDRRVISIALDAKGNIWATSSYGIYKFDKKGNFLKNYAKGDGLISDNTECLSFDKNNVLWIGTVHGISSFVLDDPSTSAGDIKKQNQVEVYPNPAKDYIKVSNVQGLSVAVYGLTGKVLWQTPCAESEQHIPLHNLPAGVYLVKAGAKVSKITVAK